MAVTNEKSTQITNLDATPRVENKVKDLGGRLRIARFDFTQGAAAGDIGSTMDLVKLPAFATVILALSTAQVSAFGAARTLDIGWRAYTEVDGDSIAASAAGLATALDVSAAAQINIGADQVLATGVKEFLGDVVLFATVAGGTIPAGATIMGQFVYVVD